MIPVFNCNKRSNKEKIGRIERIGDKMKDYRFD